MSRPHTHPCDRCKTPFHCHGELLRNHDGWPETICDLYHVEGKNFRICEACAMTAWCSDCGIHPQLPDQETCMLCANQEAKGAA